jgi:hypothetical protein
MNYSDLRRRTIRDTTQKMEPARKMGTVLIAEKIIMCRLSIAAMAFGLLLAEGFMSQQMAALQQECSGGDQNACAQVRAPNPRCTDQITACTPGLPLAPFDENANSITAQLE